MKRKGSKSDYIAERNAELKAVFFSAGIYSTSDEVMKRATSTPSSRFWVDPERARDIVSRMEKEPYALKGMNPERQRMFMEIYRRYRKVMRNNPHQSKITAVSTVIYSGAPEFFLAPSTARSIIYSKY